MNRLTLDNDDLITQPYEKLECPYEKFECSLFIVCNLIPHQNETLECCSFQVYGIVLKYGDVSDYEAMLKVS